MTGGISPFAQRTRLPTGGRRVSHRLPHRLHPGGRRGLQVEVSPADLIRLTNARTAPIATT